MTNPAKAPASVQPRRKRRKHWLQRDWRLYLMLLIPIKTFKIRNVFLLFI